MENGYNKVANQQEFDVLPQVRKDVLLETHKQDQKVLYFIHQTVDPVEFESICSAQMAKEVWDSLKITYKGVENVKKVRL